MEATIQLHGPNERRELDFILSRADMVLNPSSYEGLGLVLLEAMHRGVPVVATQARGSADLAESNQDSLFTSGNDWNAFCAGVREMAHRIRSGAIDRLRLRNWVERHYGKKALLQQWREVLLNPMHFFGLDAPDPLNNRPPLRATTAPR